ncbi:outer membrane protein TolC [Mucilaginibacter oryzae]|uniref:Outer membrane protein TolC n=1 Tax=Mucilaginibacter oryzae TaxID=468058 RepID=A0A316HI19_9SPHI|nr:TolC family protein [Mucilaginibacter oryzae]PWK80166.1 outer membrane protein TolC [Mucilaginibacter oryzae]
MKRIVLACFLTTVCLNAIGQDKLLTLNEYLAAIKRYHPIALQAALNNDKARYTRREALGGFDPKLEANREQKVFGGTSYYDYLTTELKLPLWYGIDLKGSYTSYEGYYVNPENKVPKDGLSYFGVSVPLGRGLLIDERRAAIKRAAIYQKVAANEQRQMLNDLFVNATHTYAEWLNAWLNTEVYKKAVELAQVRLNGVNLLYKNGDKPAIDTLEALTLLQSRQQKLAEYQTLLLNKKNDLAAYLWLDNLTATDPEKLDIKPDTGIIKTAIPDSLLLKEPAGVSAQNPEVNGYSLKIEQLNVERKLKLEEIKPTFNVNIGILNAGGGIFNNMNFNWLQNNQKFGFTVSMPLTFTKQRAAYSLSKIKIKEAEYSLKDKQNLITVKWNNYRNDFINFEKQIQINNAIQNNNRLLLDGEETKFKMGESSLFLVNSREQKVLDTQEKLNEIYTKRFKTIQYLKWLANNW